MNENKIQETNKFRVVPIRKYLGDEGYYSIYGYGKKKVVKKVSQEEEYAKIQKNIRKQSFRVPYIKPGLLRQVGNNLQSKTVKYHDKNTLKANYQEEFLAVLNMILDMQETTHRNELTNRAQKLKGKIEKYQHKKDDMFLSNEAKAKAERKLDFYQSEYDTTKRQILNIQENMKGIVNLGALPENQQRQVVESQENITFPSSTNTNPFSRQSSYKTKEAVLETPQILQVNKRVSLGDIQSMKGEDVKSLSHQIIPFSNKEHIKQHFEGLETEVVYKSMQNLQPQHERAMQLFMKRNPIIEVGQSPVHEYVPSIEEHYKFQSDTASIVEELNPENVHEKQLQSPSGSEHTVDLNISEEKPESKQQIEQQQFEMLPTEQNIQQVKSIESDKPSSILSEKVMLTEEEQKIPPKKNVRFEPELYLQPPPKFERKQEKAQPKELKKTDKKIETIEKRIESLPSHSTQNELDRYSNFDNQRDKKQKKDIEATVEQKIDNIYNKAKAFELKTNSNRYEDIQLAIENEIKPLTGDEKTRKQVDLLAGNIKMLQELDSDYDNMQVQSDSDISNLEGYGKEIYEEVLLSGMTCDVLKQLLDIEFNIHGIDDYTIEFITNRNQEIEDADKEWNIIIFLTDAHFTCLIHDKSLVNTLYYFDCLVNKEIFNKLMPEIEEYAIMVSPEYCIKFKMNTNRWQQSDEIRKQFDSNLCSIYTFAFITNIVCLEFNFSQASLFQEIDDDVINKYIENGFPFV